MIVPGALASMQTAVAAEYEPLGYACVFLDPPNDEEIECGAGYIDNDVCVSTLALVGQIILYLKRKQPQAATILVPEFCKGCRAVSMAAVLRTSLRRSGFYDRCTIIELDNAQVSSLSYARVLEGKAHCAAKGCPETPRIGICGNSAVIATPIFYNTVQERIEKSGCIPVFVPLQSVINEQDFLTPSLAFFSALGIKDVIGILPFGCLNGHAYVRGQLRKLQQEYPAINVTILDYDPGASDVNLINRTELIVQSALNGW